MFQSFETEKAICTRTRRGANPDRAMSAAALGHIRSCYNAGIIDYSSPIGTAIHTAGVFGPTIAGLSLIPGGFTLKRGLAFTFGGLRRSLPWTAALLAVPLVLLTAASDGLAEGFSPISAMGVFLAALMVSGGNEELGWRAVLEPELERRIPFFAACLATGAIWGLWHLPLWFTQGAGRETTPFLRS